MGARNSCKSRGGGDFLLEHLESEIEVTGTEESRSA